MRKSSISKVNFNCLDKFFKYQMGILLKNVEDETSRNLVSGLFSVN